MSIKAVLECFNSKTDRNGNRYWAFRYTDTASSRMVCGSISGGESNVYSIKRGMGFESEEVHFTRCELPIREFNSLTKAWLYAGCTAEELAAFIRSQLAKAGTL